MPPEVRHPQGVRVRRTDLPVHLVRRARRGLVGNRGPALFAADNAAEPHPPHQAFHRAAGYRGALPGQLPPNLAGPIDPEVGSMHPPDLLHEQQVLPSARRGARRISTLRDMGIIGRRCDPQHPADRLDTLAGWRQVRAQGRPIPRLPGKQKSEALGEDAKDGGLLGRHTGTLGPSASTEMMKPVAFRLACSPGGGKPGRRPPMEHRPQGRLR